MYTLKAINRRVREIQLSEQAHLVSQAARIRAELKQGVKKAFKEVLETATGDSHKTGMKPISFVRQVIAVCLCPELLNSNTIPVDARERARRLLSECEGGSVGSLSDSRGIPYVRRSVSDFIARRDGGVPAFPHDIFICSGSQMVLMLVLRLLIYDEGISQTGILVPVPGYYHFNALLTELGAAMVPYYLCEDEGWALKVDELHRALQASRHYCSPKVLYLINPGNPTAKNHFTVVAGFRPFHVCHVSSLCKVPWGNTKLKFFEYVKPGHVQSRKSIEEVIRFAAEENLFLMADEVYQDNVHGEDCEFVSYKKVLFEMGPPYSDTVQLASFHSVSKGFMGECGLRSGYVELVNIDPAVKERASALCNTGSCPTVTGQIALNIMVDPPRLGDPSYTTFSQETNFIKDTLACNMRHTKEVLHDLPGFSYQAARGGFYAFPSLHLPERAVNKAKEEGMDVELLYCTRLLEEEGVCMGLGSKYGQQEGNNHIRLTLMSPREKVEEVLRRLRDFHLRFMQEFS